MMIDATTQWKTHVPSDGSGIADPKKSSDPDKYGWTNLGFGLDATLFATEGKPWSVWEAYTTAEVAVPASGVFSLRLSFDLMVDDLYVKNGFLVETDTIFCSADGYNTNLSAQRLGNKMQIAGQGVGDWVDTGFTPPLLTPNLWHPHLFQYEINLDKRMGGVQAMWIDETLFIVPSRLQGIIALRKGWTPGALLQIQSCLNGNGGASNFMMRNIQYTVT